mgnify:CR=1 FL=1
MPMVGGTQGEVVIPDVAEAIVAYRAWRIDEIQGLSYLTSMNNHSGTGEYWLPGTYRTALCHCGHYYTGCPCPDCEKYEATIPHDPCPQEESDCGLYAFKNLEVLFNSYHDAEVVGEVWLWGQVVEHDSGYRAEHVEIKTLYVRVDEDGKYDKGKYYSHSATVEAIAELYEVDTEEHSWEEGKPWDHYLWATRVMALVGQTMAHQIYAPSSARGPAAWSFFQMMSTANPPLPGPPTKLLTPWNARSAFKPTSTKDMTSEQVLRDWGMLLDDNGGLRGAESMMANVEEPSGPERALQDIITKFDASRPVSGSWIKMVQKEDKALTDIGVSKALILPSEVRLQEPRTVPNYAAKLRLNLDMRWAARITNYGPLTTGAVRRQAKFKITDLNMS